MCDPLTVLMSLGGAFAAKALAPKAPKFPTSSQPDPAAERAAAEASATQAANAQLAESKRAKRMNALALGGATSQTLGQGKGNGTSVLGAAASTSAF